MSLKKADKLTPRIQLSSILKELAPTGASIDRIIVGSPDYLKNLTSILSSTSDKTIRNYLIWKVIQSYYTKIEAEELKPYNRFVNVLQGKVASLSFH
jgi:endothelin-converting enzyme